jgi:hypothetical protein
MCPSVQQNIQSWLGLLFNQALQLIKARLIEQPGNFLPVRRFDLSHSIIITVTWVIAVMAFQAGRVHKV